MRKRCTQKCCVLGLQIIKKPTRKRWVMGIDWRKREIKTYVIFVSSKKKKWMFQIIASYGSSKRTENKFLNWLIISENLSKKGGHLCSSLPANLKTIWDVEAHKANVFKWKSVCTTNIPKLLCCKLKRIELDWY